MGGIRMKNTRFLTMISVDRGSSVRVTVFVGFVVCLLAASSTVHAGGIRRGAWVDSADRLPIDLEALDGVKDGVGEVGTESLGGNDGGAIQDDAGSSGRGNNPFGLAGSWRWAVYSGGAFDIQSDGEQYNVHLAASYFFVDGFNVNLEIGGLYFDEPDRFGADSGGFNSNLLFRWHFLRKETWSIYADAGAGVLWSGERVPHGGTRFNFTPQAGVGASLEIDRARDIRLFGGLRWHHISNANITGSDENPGRDSIMGYIGLDFPM